jgi:LacI family transcriptional regulator
MARRVLERKFMQYLGRSPSQELRRLRINQARKLLSQTDLAMQEIAEACGYATYSYLGTVFKKETGVSPGDYRKQSRRPRI